LGEHQSFTSGGDDIPLGVAVTFPVGEFTVLATFVDDCGAIYERSYTGTVVPTVLEPALAAEVLACGQVNFTLSGELGNNNEPVFYYGDSANSSGPAASFNYADYQPGATLDAVVELQECGVTATAAATFTFPAPQWSIVAGDCGLVSVNVIDPAGYSLLGVDYTGNGQFTPALNYTFTEDGEYPLTLQWADACGNVFVFTESITVDVPAVPSPTIEAQVGACGAVNFVVAGLGTDYQIYYGYPDATTSGTDLTYVYPACGSYQVRLQTSTCGQTAEAFVTINLACPTYSVSTEECGQVSLSLELPAEYVLHSINYGDGSPASNSLLHTYTVNGTYTITPTVENTCTGELINLSAQTVTILLPATPDAAFTSAEVSCGLYNFVATENGPQITHQWIINGMIHPNTTGSLSNINLVNNTANTIEHTVFGDCANATSTTAISPACIVCPPLQPAITVLEMECLTVTFSIDLSGGTVWNINYGDGNTGNTSTHTYQTYGTYEVLLTVENDCGELVEVSLNLSLAPPVVSPSISIANQSCRTLTFAVAPDDLLYSIDYGDGQSGTALVHSYADDLLSAVATVNYEVCGLPFSASTSVDFPVLPSLTMTLSSCGELAVVLSNLGTAEVLNIIYGDGSLPTSELEHTYAASGTYLVSVALQTESCGVITLTEEVTVELPPPPTATFSLTVDECGLIQITDIVTDEEVVSYCFSFEGGSCSAANLSYQVTSAGSYEVAMMLTGTCSPTVVSETIEVTLPPVPSATPISVGNNACGRYTFQVALPSDPGLQYEWIFPNGTTVSATDNDQVMYRFLYTGLYEIILNVVHPNCEFLSATYPLSVYPIVTHALPLAVDQSTDCLDADLFVDFLPVEVSDLQWSISEGTITNTTSNGIEVTFPATGIYEYSLSYLDHCNDMQELSGQVTVEECLLQDQEHAYGKPARNTSDVVASTAEVVETQTKGDTPIVVYPNPVQDLLYLQGPLETASNWRLVNGVGQTVFERASISGEKFALSIKAFPAGTYTLLYMDKGEQLHSKRIVVLPY
jgi:PKD repeat protein